MAITTSIQITSMKAKNSWQGKDHVIEAINFDVSATDGKFTHTMNGVQYIDFDPDNFVEWEDSADFEAKAIEWTTPYSAELIAACVAEVTELAKEEEETLEFTYNK